MLMVISGRGGGLKVVMVIGCNDGMVMTMLLKMFMMVNIKMNFTHTILPVHNKLLQISDQKSSQPEMH